MTWTSGDPDFDSYVRRGDPDALRRLARRFTYPRSHYEVQAARVRAETLPERPDIPEDILAAFTEENT